MSLPPTRESRPTAPGTQILCLEYFYRIRGGTPKQSELFSEPFDLKNKRLHGQRPTGCAGNGTASHYGKESFLRRDLSLSPTGGSFHNGRNLFFYRSSQQNTRQHPAPGKHCFTNSRFVYVFVPEELYRSIPALQGAGRHFYQNAARQTLTVLSAQKLSN